MRLDNYVRLCYINLFDLELRCAVSGRRVRLIGGYYGSHFRSGTVRRFVSFFRLHLPWLYPRSDADRRVQRRIRIRIFDPPHEVQSDSARRLGGAGSARNRAVLGAGENCTRLVYLQGVDLYPRRRSCLLCSAADIYRLRHRRLAADRHPAPTADA